MKIPPQNPRVIRERLKMSQVQFSERYGIPISSLRQWEQGTRHPSAVSNAYLLTIAKAPYTVAEALKESYDLAR